MTRFLVLYNADTSAQEQMAQATPEQQQAGMEAWMQWAQKTGPALVELGSPVQAAGRVTAGGDTANTCPACGWSVLEADSEHAARQLLEGHPHLMMPGASIDVFEALPIPGM
jgi:hypothetical protein